MGKSNYSVHRGLVASVFFLCATIQTFSAARPQKPRGSRKDYDEKAGRRERSRFLSPYNYYPKDSPQYDLKLSDTSSQRLRGDPPSRTAQIRVGTTFSPTSSSSPTTTPVPSKSPTSQPTSMPTSSRAPTEEPSSLPTYFPSSEPSSGPTAPPTSSSSPTEVPKERPTEAPSTEPSSAPTAVPTSSSAPTEVPSNTPSETPTSSPSSLPTREPSSGPTAVPTSSSTPTEAPTEKPTEGPTEPSSAPTAVPTFSSEPTNKPTTLPTSSNAPKSAPSSVPSTSPSSAPSGAPSGMPSAFLSVAPSAGPNASPSSVPTVSTAPTSSQAPTYQPSNFVQATYTPGDLTVSESGLLLSTGLTARKIATTGEPVDYVTGGASSIPFHGNPDMGATFVDERPGNEGGWIYVSNSEMRRFRRLGGVGSITFDRNGDVIDYQMVLTRTTANCGGGRTPWGAWISCEEVRFGNLYQVDPTGEIQPRGPITLGSDGGFFESFAYDVRNPLVPRFFVTEDRRNGALQRFTPKQPNWDDPWSILYGDGHLDYLILDPEPGNDKGVYRWSSNKTEARANAEDFYLLSEGMDIIENRLYFISKWLRQLYILDLDGNTYTNHTTTQGLFDGAPDQILHILGQRKDKENVLYFTEEGGRRPGIHGRNELGQFFTILESDVYDPDETTGFAFSPDNMHLYVCYQLNGVCFDVTRKDGLPFSGRTLNVKYHAVA